MKVKCRGFEGNLISISPEIEMTSALYDYKNYIYIIKIAINARQEITISGVKDEDIEFMKRGEG